MYGVKNGNPKFTVLHGTAFCHRTPLRRQKSFLKLLSMALELGRTPANMELRYGLLGDDTEGKGGKSPGLMTPGCGRGMLSQTERSLAMVS